MCHVHPTRARRPLTPLLSTSPHAVAQVQTEKESKGQALVAVGLGAFFLAAFAVGYSLDPPY